MGLGEICVSGFGVGGELENEEYPSLFRTRFQVPLQGTNRDLIYKTGRFRQLAADGISSSWYIDHQVKIRGFRIELGEVRAVLKVSTLACEETVVLARMNWATGDLVAYVVANAEQAPPSVNCVAFAKLPTHEPSALSWRQFLEDAWVKVNRRALPVPMTTSGSEDHSSSYERRKTATLIWAPVIGLERVGTYTTTSLGWVEILSV